MLSCLQTKCCSKLKKTNEKLVKEKEDVLKESKEDNAKWRKKVDSLKQKTAGLELERAKLESKLSSLNLGDPEAGPSRGSAGPGLFQVGFLTIEDDIIIISRSGHDGQLQGAS